jgi:long-subunit acyl-CoA synthetase (AMP-forming)
MNATEFLDLLHGPERANLTALETLDGPLTYRMLDECVRARADRLAACGAHVVASLMDNGADWIIQDLACLRASLVHLPLPLFFTPEQLLGAMAAAGADALVANPSMGSMLAKLDFAHADALSETLTLFRRSAPAVPLHPGTAKITFTSGSTGQPKGVCLAADAMLAVAEGLASATGTLDIRRHLTALPLPVLLENIAGVYAPLMKGAAIVIRPLEQVGLQGSSRFDASAFHAALENSAAQSVITLPQMLRAYAGWLRASGTRAPADLRLVAVGGAAVGPDLLAGARALGLPAYEGYGLSEACSVQTLNLPGADCPGSAGQALPHARVRIAPDGEILVSGSLALGYLGQAATLREWLPTGDLGHLDAAGFLHIQGRKKNVLITGFGRNVSPEWIEVQLANQPAIAHAVVLGEGQPVLGSVIWPLGDAGDDAIGACVDRVNRNLPDYARIGRWTRARAEFSAASGLATANGRPRRHAVAELHQDLFSHSSDLSTP